MYQIVDATGIENKNLQLEIPEIAISQRPQLAIQHLNELKSYNIGVGISDFGSNYDPLTYLSLTYLMGFSINRVKIDSNLWQENIQDGQSNFGRPIHDISFCEQLINPVSYTHLTLPTIYSV